MPEIKGDNIYIPVRDESEFTDKCATIMLDKAKGIKALICRLVNKNATAIRTVLFPKKTFTTKEAEDWIEDHDLSRFFIKQLLYTGRWEHPQSTKDHPLPSIVMTKQKLKAIAGNVSSYLTMGGNIAAVTPPHPDSDVQKIRQTIGYLMAVFQLTENDLQGIVYFTDNEAVGWVRDEKVKTVSPSIVYEVHTAHGIYDSLFDHICVTPDPYLTKQDEFVPMVAESFSKAVVLYESTYQIYEGTKSEEAMKDKKQQDEEKGFLTKIAKLFGFNISFGKDKKGEHTVTKSETDEEEVIEEKEETTMTKEEQATLEKDVADLKKKNADLEIEKKELQDKIDAESASKETEQNEAVKTEIDELVKTGKVKPTERDELEKTLEGVTKSVNFGDSRTSIIDAVLKPYRERKAGKETKPILNNKVQKIRVGEKVFDLDDVKERNEFNSHVRKELVAYNRGHKDSPMSYPDMRQKLLDEGDAVVGGE